MKPKAILPLLLALVLGLATFFVGRRVLNKQVAGPTTVKSSKVLVAASALPAGHQLAATDVKLADALAEAVTPTMFRDPNDIEGRILAAPVEPGQVLRQSTLAPEGAVSGLQAKVPPGMRAVTIAVNEFSGLAGLITPGVSVDLIATLVDNITGETFAKTIVQNVQVSAVGRELEVGEQAKADPRAGQKTHKTVTLLVTPTQAAAIDLAFSKSKPRLVLRGSDDEAAVTDPGVTMAELSGRDDEDRLSSTTSEGADSKIAEMLSAMQKQIQDVAAASQEAARQAAAEQARGAINPGPADMAALVHSVRVFRGGSESREQFDDQGRPVGAANPPRPAANPPVVTPPGDAATPGASPKRESQQVKVNASEENRAERSRAEQIAAIRAELAAIRDELEDWDRAHPEVAERLDAIASSGNR